MREALSSREFRNARDYLLSVKRTVSDRLFKKLEHLLPYPGQELTQKLSDYEKLLCDLAYRWHLRVPWGGRLLVLDHIYDLIGMTREDVWNAEIPIEILEPLLPSPPLRPLRLEISAYELLFSGRQEIQNRFIKKLVDYENKLKSMGWEELPSPLETHALWWFEHYVHKKKYTELENEYASASAESIKRAAWNFRKLLGIEIK